MKIFLAVFVLTNTTPFSTGQYCQNITGRNSEQHLCYDYQLSPEIPLTLSKKYNALWLENATGSIGLMTFFTMPLKSLVISDSTIFNINHHALCPTPELEEIYIESNVEFPEITAEMADNCRMLKKLSIQNFRSKPSIFKNMPNLQVLIIRRSKIKNLTKEYFEPLTHLKEIYILYSEIEEIEPRTLCVSESLQILTIYMTTLPKISLSTLSGCNGLTELSITSAEDNPIPVEEYSLHQSPSLRRLTLRKVTLQHLSAEFLKNNQNLTEIVIDVSGDIYPAVEENSLSNLINLETLSLYHFRISHLKVVLLRGLINLKILDLNDCNIETIDAGAFSDQKNLRELNLGRNKIQTMNSNVFEDLQQLKRLHMSSNKLTAVDNLPNLPNLEYFVLGDNPITTMNVNNINEKFPKMRHAAVDTSHMSCEYQKYLETQNVTMLFVDPRCLDML